MFVLTRGIDYEGEDPLGVYETAEDARHAAQAYVAGQGYGDSLYAYEFKIGAAPSLATEYTDLWDRHSGWRDA